MKLLLTSVFKPFGVDDKYGRKENIAELYHNQVTREQGIFSIRYNHRSFGLYLIAENIKCPTVVLDFPSIKRFIREIKKGYDYVGISFITPNFIKAKKMAELIREHSPKTKIIIGGHGTHIPEIEEKLSCDHVVRGEGIAWFRDFFKEKADTPLKHPIIPSAENKKVMGIPLFSKSGILLPGVGCPNGCKFCSTSHYFKFEHISFFPTGRELFDICVKMEKEYGCKDFFVMDENFLKNKKRAMELLELLKKHNKKYYFGIFSSAEAIVDFGVDKMFELGVGFLWVGVESYMENYSKNKGIDMPKLFESLKNHGISILASNILFQEHHTKENIWEEVAYMKKLAPDFTQFMELGPLPKTALYDEYDEAGKLLHDVPFEEWHGQDKIWFKHPNFSRDETSGIIKEAFRRDFHELGPSILRMCDTYMKGYLHTSKYSDPWKLARNEELKTFCKSFYPLLDAMKPYLPSKASKEYLREVEGKYKQIFGQKSLADKALTKVVRTLAFKENILLNVAGDVRQPPTFSTTYRKPLLQFFTAPMQGRALPDMSFNFLEVKLKENLPGKPVRLELYGIMDEINVKKLSVKIAKYFKKEQKSIALDIGHITKADGKSLIKLFEKSKDFHSIMALYYDSNTKELAETLEFMKNEFRQVSFVEIV